MSSRSLVLLSLALALCLSLSSAQNGTAVYFTALSAAGVYPATCTTGVLSCAANGTGWACGAGTASGTHNYYPAATAPTFSSALVAGAVPQQCEKYTADFQLPLTTGGLNVQYGPAGMATCVNYRLRNSSTSVIIADPDAVEAYPLSFTFSATQSAVPGCPAPVASSGGAATVWFTYSAVNATSTICGAGSLSCTSLGSGYFSCPTLNAGAVHYWASNADPLIAQSVPLTQTTECNGLGDGYLPLDYEGISFSGAFGSQFNCISWYGHTSGGVSKQSFEFYTIGSTSQYTTYSGNQSFTFTTSPAATTARALCSQFIPALGSLAPGNGNGNSTGAASAVGASAVSAVLAAAVAASAALLL